MEFITLAIILGVAYKLLTGRESHSKNTILVKDVSTGKLEKKKIRQARDRVEIEKPENFIINEEIREILYLLENTNNNLFLTGKAGTGKSTLLKYFRADTKKSLAVVAPTGIAAINVQGQTIHNFFGFGIDITPERVRKVSNERLKTVQKIDMLIIDEISMVRADLFECVDRSLKLNRRCNEPFGGVQLVVIGDLYQLPPVVKSNEKRIFTELYTSAFFFGSKAYKNSDFIKKELSNVFRQSDSAFIDLLNNIRKATIREEDLELLNSKVVSDSDNIGLDSVHLVTTNKIANHINETKMDEIDAPSRAYEGVLSGVFKEKDIPVPKTLLLKIGTKAMLLNNDKKGRWVNGDVVKVTGLHEDSLTVEFDDDTVCTIHINEWENVKFVYDEEEKKVVPKKIGTYSQIPIKPAWAITIHKSQGQTLKKVHLDIGNGAFAPGQTYVALSRCKSFEGLSLERPIMPHDIFVNVDVKRYMGFTTPVQDEAISSNQSVLNNDELLAGRADDLSDFSAKVLQVIKKSPGIKARAIANILGVDRRSVNRALYYDLGDLVEKDENHLWQIRNN